MTCGCTKCRKITKRTRRNAACSPGILYILSKMKAPKNKVAYAGTAKKVKRRKKNGKFIKNKKVTKVRRKKVIGQKRKNK